ncbi:adhesion G-protein coupled receptor G2-like [Notamacropus eugenii]|uniref:adhesion G-protein coupled receptor G2-like n=1 Tax=Notamacropus eugenii TaxID=9315 RepID=UPI003B66FE22
MGERKKLRMLVFLLFTLVSRASAEIRVKQDSDSPYCEENTTEVNYTICQCNHLTNIGVFRDESRFEVEIINRYLLMIITYTGCLISCTFLGLSMLIYIAFETCDEITGSASVYRPLRQVKTSKILVNTQASLLLSTLLFMINSLLSAVKAPGLCVSTSVLFHYFLMASFTWMGLRCADLYLSMVRVFNIYTQHYIPKFCAVGWGLPALTMAAMFVVRKNNCSVLMAESPCWIQNNLIFYISILGYFGFTFVISGLTYLFVLFKIDSAEVLRLKAYNMAIPSDFKNNMILFILLGLYWGLGFFAWGPLRLLFLYFFAFLSGAEGYLVFYFHCVVKRNVRMFWQKYMCCPKIAAEESTDPGESDLDLVRLQRRRQNRREGNVATQVQEDAAAQPAEVAAAQPEEVAAAQPEEVAAAQPAEVAAAQPEEVAAAQPAEVAAAQPEEVAAAQPEEVAAAQPAEVAAAQPEEVAAAQPEEIDAVQTEEVIAIQPEEVTELRCEDITESEIEEIAKLQCEEVTSVRFQKGSKV